MCVYSQVLDYFKPTFPNLDEHVGDWDYLRRLLEDFRKAEEAAKLVDKLTNQPDCEDPQKVLLLDKVEKLEKLVKRKRGKKTNAPKERKVR